VDDSGVSRPGDLDDGLGPVPAPNDQRPAASAQACVEVSQRLQQEAKTALMPGKAAGQQVVVEDEQRHDRRRAGDRGAQRRIVSDTQITGEYHHRDHSVPPAP
jgi:hypothetical protein